MQTNGETPTSSEEPTEKKPPPKPTKRVSFNLKKQFIQKSSPSVPLVNGGVTQDCPAYDPIDKRYEKFPATSDPANPNPGTEPHGKPLDSPTRRPLLTTNDRLKLEFVKISETSPKLNAAPWVSTSFDTQPVKNVKSPTYSIVNFQSRLTETQSKIAKLQQSLPTKLSDATVESLKSKYSPASFGYPKTFIRPPESSKIPSFTSKGTTKPVLQSFKRKAESVAKEAKEEEKKENKSTAKDKNISVESKSTATDISGVVSESSPTKFEKKPPREENEVRVVDIEQKKVVLPKDKFVTAENLILEVNITPEKESTLDEQVSVGPEENNSRPVLPKGNFAPEIKPLDKLLPEENIVPSDTFVPAEKFVAEEKFVTRERLLPVERLITEEKVIASTKLLREDNILPIEELDFVGESETGILHQENTSPRKKYLGVVTDQPSDVIKAPVVSIPEATAVLNFVSKNETNIPVPAPRSVTVKASITPELEVKKTYRTEILIYPSDTPVITEKEENNNETIVKSSPVTSEKILQLPIVKAKCISSEIFPKESVRYEEPKKGLIIPEKPVDVIEQSSDTLTESEDSDNSQKLLTESKKPGEDSESTVTVVEESESDIVCPLVPIKANTSEMEDQKKKSSKKRSNSFRRIFSFGSSKDKKKEDSNKVTKTNGIKKKDNVVADNAQNEAHAFDRSAPQRHTVGGHYNPKGWEGRSSDNTASEPFYSNTYNDNIQRQYSFKYYDNTLQQQSSPGVQSRSGNESSNRIEDRQHNIQYDIHVTQQSNELNSNLISSSENTLDEYVCMDSSDKSNRTDLTQPGFINAHHIDKYIDTTSSSSISTLESDTRNNMYENSLKATRPGKIQNVNSKIPMPNSSSLDKNTSSSSTGTGEKCYERPKFADSPEMFTTAPRRTQGPQLIKPKAIIPLNTERPLPIPYSANRQLNEKSLECCPRENMYGNIPNLDTVERSLNDIGKQMSPKGTIYGKPVPAARRNISLNEVTYGNLPSDGRSKPDSLIPVGAQLKITRPVEINGNKCFDKLRSRSVSPSQRHRATNVNSPVMKTKPPIPSSPSSPNRKELEATKLRLPANREKAEPRLKSPVDERRNQSRKLSDANKKEGKNSFSTHQNLEIEIDYPDNNINEAQDRKETPEKMVFSNEKPTEPTSPRKVVNLKRSTPVSSNRPKSFTTSTPKGQNDRVATPPEIPNIASLRSPVLVRTESPVSISSSQSVSSLSPRSKLPVTSEDLKDLKNTEVYFWEQTSRGDTPVVKKEEASPNQSPQQVVTQVTVHHSKPPMSPQRPVASLQKMQNMQNVEAYYWQQIKKLKEKEEHELYNQHLQMMARQQALNLAGVPHQGRSRSLSAGAPRQGQRRSLSLPRDALPPNQRTSNDMYGYARQGRQMSIPEGRPVDSRLPVERLQQDYGVVRQNPVPQNTAFVRGSSQRSTIGPISTQKEKLPPNDPSIYENYFPGVELRHQAKATDNNQAGYAPIFKRGSLVSGPSPHHDSPTQNNNKKVSFSSAKSDDQVWPTKNGFTQSPPTRRVDKKTDSLDDDVFLPNQPPPQIPQTRDPIYAGKLDPNWMKQVSVNNKVCDMYGQIHDAPKPSGQVYGNVQKSGVIYGQLQQNPVPSSPMSSRSPCLYRSDPSFVRGTRLTASFGDMRRDGLGEAPRRPLPPIPPEQGARKGYGRVHLPVSESESGSEAGEVMRILQRKERPRGFIEEEWNSDSKSGRSQSGPESGGGGGSRGGGLIENEGEVRSGRSRSGRREDPRRHTLSGADQHYPTGMSAPQGGPLSRTMDLEVPMPRGYPPPSSAMLFDDDPGIMSEVETSSTGFRRGGKQRSSLPVVRTPSKTLERPLGLVFLQYRNETKRALLPNEITSIDTVKALFVRSFPKQLTMEYLDSPLVKIYIHDSSKDMFYELEDLRSHLRDIRDRSVLRLFESADISGGLPGPGTGISGGIGHFEDQSYFSEPEFDSEYQHQHIHKSKTSGAKGAPPYYMGSTTMPRGGPLLRAYSPAIGGPIPTERLKTLPADRMHTDGYMSSPERGSRAQYEDPYYSQYATRSGSITPVIDEEASDTELLDESYSLYGVKLAPPGGARAVPAPRTQFPSAPTAVPYDATRIRVENMERQLANLTGLVQKALHQNPVASREFLQVPTGRDSYRSDKSVSFEKSVSFSDEPPDMNSPKQHSPQHAERDRLKPAPPPKPASLSPAQYDNSRHIYRDLQLTPEMYNQLRGLQKKAKDLRTEVRNLRRLSQAQAHSVRETIRDTFIKIRAMLLASGEQVWQAGIDQEKLRLSREEDLYKQEMLRLEKDLTELEATVEELRGNVINRKTRVNMSDVENMALILSKSSKTVADLKLRFPGLQDAMKNLLSSEMEKVVREEKFLKEEPERLENALRRCKKLTGTLVTLKRLASVQEQRLPCTNNTGDGRLSPSLTETPPITPPSAQHSKGGSGVPGTRPGLGSGVVGGDGTSGVASDNAQRPENALDALLDELQTFSKPHPTASTVTTQLPQGATSYSTKGGGGGGGTGSGGGGTGVPPTMADIGRKGSMDSATLLPVQSLTVSTATGSLRRLHSYPSGSDTDNSPPIQPLARPIGPAAPSASKPPIPERNAELLQQLASGRRVPPPPPPRTSSKSPLASPTSPGVPARNALQDKPPQTQSQFEAATQNLGLGTLRRNVPGRSSLKEKAQTLPRNIGSNLQPPGVDGSGDNKPNAMSASNSSSCESVNSQEGAKKSGSRKEELEQRHQELLKKQKALQEQYARLQQLQRGNNTLAVVPPAPDLLLKKTGSESNLLHKMGLQMAAPHQVTGSLTHLANATLSTAPAGGNVPTSTAPAADGGPTSTPATGAATTTSKVYETDIL